MSRSHRRVITLLSGCASLLAVLALVSSIQYQAVQAQVILSEINLVLP